MSNEEQIFKPFTAAEPPQTFPAASEAPKRGRKPRTAKPKTVKAAKAPKREARAAKPKAAEPAAMKISIAEAMSVLAGLKTEDGALFEQLAVTLNGVGAGQRERVLDALKKLFG